MTDSIWQLLLNTIKEAAYLIPFIAVAYLMVELLVSPHANEKARAMAHSEYLGVPIGTITGSLPLLGVPGAFAILLSYRMITPGVFAAVAIASWDGILKPVIENIQSSGTVLWIFVVKFVSALLVGFVVNKVLFDGSCKQELKCDHDTERRLAHIRLCKMHGCREHHSLPRRVLAHTLKLGFFIFVILLISELVVYTIGIGNIEGLLQTEGVLTPYLSALLCLIPGRAVPGALASLFFAGKVSKGAAAAGLITSSGMGLSLLFYKNRRVAENMKILLVIFLMAVSVGMVMQVL